MLDLADPPRLRPRLCIIEEHLNAPQQHPRRLSLATLPSRQRARVDAEAFRCLSSGHSQAGSVPDEPPAQGVRRRQRIVAEEPDDGGMQRISGLTVFASQLNTLHLSTPTWSATSFWSNFNASRLLRM